MTSHKQYPHVFLSHNAADKPYVEKLASALQLVGCQVWFDACVPLRIAAGGSEGFVPV